MVGNFLILEEYREPAMTSLRVQNSLTMCRVHPAVARPWDGRAVGEGGPEQQWLRLVLPQTRTARLV